MDVAIRDCRLPEDLPVLTPLLHRAFADLAARGLRYVASHQTPDITEKRIRAGRCFVAEKAGRLVGTITVRASRPSAQVPFYREEGVMIFGQFGVEPDERSKGIGRMLHDHAIAYARESGARIMALDTAAPAVELIETYHRWGYREVARHRWSVTNYESVVLKKDLLCAGQLSTSVEMR